MKYVSHWCTTFSQNLGPIQVWTLHKGGVIHHLHTCTDWSKALVRRRGHGRSHVSIKDLNKTQKKQKKSIFWRSTVINEKSHHCGDILGVYRRVWFSKKHISCGLRPPLIYFFGEPDSCDITTVM